MLNALQWMAEQHIAFWGVMVVGAADMLLGLWALYQVTAAFENWVRQVGDASMPKAYFYERARPQLTRGGVTVFAASLLMLGANVLCMVALVTLLMLNIAAGIRKADFITRDDILRRIGSRCRTIEAPTTPSTTFIALGRLTTISAHNGRHEEVADSVREIDTTMRWWLDEKAIDVKTRSAAITNLVQLYLDIRESVNDRRLLPLLSKVACNWCVASLMAKGEDRNTPVGALIAVEYSMRDDLKHLSYSPFVPAFEQAMNTAMRLARSYADLHQYPSAESLLSECQVVLESLPATRRTPRHRKLAETLIATKAKITEMKTEELAMRAKAHAAERRARQLVSGSVPQVRQALPSQSARRASIHQFQARDKR